MGRLLDSNILIYAAGEYASELLPTVLASDVCVADVTWIEVLGYHGITREQDAALRAIRRDLRSIATDDEVIEEAIRLRRLRKMSLGDAIVAGTAMINDFI